MPKALLQFESTVKKLQAESIHFPELFSNAADEGGKMNLETSDKFCEYKPTFQQFVKTGLCIHSNKKRSGINTSIA